MAKIIGNTTATPNPRPDWNQTDETKADYIKNKPDILTEEDVIDILSENGITGDSGTTFMPAVSEDGVISWTNDGGLENPAPVNIKGEQGPQGIQGEAGPQGPQGEIGPQGERGEQGPKGDTGEKGADGAQGPKGDKGDDGKQGADGKSAYAFAKEGGYTGTEAQFAKKLAETPYKVSVREYGAKGDGSTNDTAAFKNALANNRVVYVPGGTYILNDTLTVRANCELELAQDAVLRFQKHSSKTSYNAITLLRLASLRGNHATIFVHYDFGGNVINADTGDDQAALGNLTGDALDSANATAVPPFEKWDPQWKMSRYVTDINICKQMDGQYSKFCYSADGQCYGTAINMHCDQADLPHYMWGVSMSGVRIAGGFNYGIHAHNIGKGWNHDMRIEAVIDACKIAVLMDNCHHARLAVTIQPREAKNGTVYAEHGIKLVNSEYTDLSSVKVWDWNADKTLWSNNGVYQHIALFGNCPGVILDDYLYWYNGGHVRDQIYTDTPSNLEKMTILQEPITRWFKPKDGDPYFYNGNADYKLVTQDTMDGYFDTDVVKRFEDVLPASTGLDGTLFSDNGYRIDRFLKTSGIDETSDGYYGCTGLIPCKKGDVIYAAGLNIQNGPVPYDKVNANGEKNGDGMVRYVLLDANNNKIMHCNHANVHDSFYYGKYYNTDDGFRLEIPNITELDNLRHIRFGFHIATGLGSYPMISVNNPLEYSMEGFLADSIKVNDDNIESTRLNTLNTRVTNFEQNIAESMSALEAEVTGGLETLENDVDARFNNLSITSDNVDFILADGGENVLVPKFKDTLPSATDTDGTIYNGTGYKRGVRVVLSSGLTDTADNNFVATGFIPCEYNSTINMQDIDFSLVHGWVGIVLYDASHQRMTSMAAASITGDSDMRAKYTKTDNGCTIALVDVSSSLKYIRCTFHSSNFGTSPKIAVDEEIAYDTVWQGEPRRLDETIYAQNVFLTSPSGKAFKITVSDDGVLSATAYTG